MRYPPPFERRCPKVLNLLSILLTGLVIGLAARFLYPGAVDMGLGRTILLGIAGSLVAGVAASLGNRQSFADGVNRAGCIASVVGAMVLIFLGRHF
nr:GlsB/YeaQ/YmgE family stress response membrane protein [Novosphingobium sp. FKTRR1]